MNAFGNTAPIEHATQSILLLQDTKAVSLALAARLNTRFNIEIVHCASMQEAKEAVDKKRFDCAISGLQLRDAQSDQILSFFDQSCLPVVIFTATHDPRAADHYAEMKLIDYIVKEDAGSLNRVVAAAMRVLGNRDYGVLIVDDSQVARLELSLFLKRHNFRVFEAKSGREALNTLAREHIDLVLTDYHMPDMDGYELTRRVTAERCNGEFRVIGISASTDRRISARFLKAGASDFIYRPFVAEELQCRINNNIATLHQIRRLKTMAERDVLTGLSNRRHFFELAERYSQNMDLHDGRDCVAMLDVDHFKKVNDTYGHEAGDKVLQAIARVLSQTCANTPHLVGRLGGEEFALYLRGCDEKDAIAFCERLREFVAMTVIESSDHMIQVTASFGVAPVYPSESFSNHLNAADQLLYIAKKSGRNRVFGESTLKQ